MKSFPSFSLRIVPSLLFSPTFFLPCTLTQRFSATFSTILLPLFSEVFYCISIPFSLFLFQISENVSARTPTNSWVSTILSWSLTLERQQSRLDSNVIQVYLWLNMDYAATKVDNTILCGQMMTLTAVSSQQCTIPTWQTTRAVTTLHISNHRLAMYWIPKRTLTRLSPASKS